MKAVIPESVLRSTLSRREIAEAEAGLEPIPLQWFGGVKLRHETGGQYYVEGADESVNAFVSLCRHRSRS